jgi:hypothetical protein
VPITEKPDITTAAEVYDRYKRFGWLVSFSQCEFIDSIQKEINLSDLPEQDGWIPVPSADRAIESMCAILGFRWGNISGYLLHHAKLIRHVPATNVELYVEEGIIDLLSERVTLRLRQASQVAFNIEPSGAVNVRVTFTPLIRAQIRFQYPLD